MSTPPSLSQRIRAQLESASSPLSTRTLARRIGARPRRLLAALRAGAGARVAYQDVDLASGTYANILAVGPEERRAWLGARLTATFERADDGRGTSPGTDGSGIGPGRLWIVRFERVGVELFGVELSAKTFDDVTRAWDQTFVDEEFRVVRAARTLEALAKANARGRRAVAGDEDDCVFVMRRRERRG